MLLRLHIQDLAIIDALTLDFSEGFTALTGETGAGKSIVIGALNLVLGERASAEDVRSGCPLAVAEALFDIRGQRRLLALFDEMNLLDSFGEPPPKVGDGEPVELVLRREISAQGRGRCLVNGRLVALGQLRQIGDLLVDLHGQHQHQSLLKAELHREILDAFGGEPLAEALGAYGRLYARHAETLRRLCALSRDERQIEREKSILEHQLGEIRDAALAVGEDEALEVERRRLAHADALLRNAAGAIDLLYEGESQPATVADLMAQCVGLLGESARLDPSLEALAERLDAAQSEVEDVAATLRSYASDLEHDPQRLGEVEDRLHLIRQLKRKYGATIPEILSEAERFAAELHGLVHSTEERERLEAERIEIEKALAQAAETLCEKRRAVGGTFAKGLSRHLSELEMPHVRFEVHLGREEAGGKPVQDDSDAEGWDDASAPEPPAAASGAPTIRFPDGRSYRVHPYGVDQVEFLLSPNPGEPLKALRRIASGGELSRIMLALKALMRDQTQIPTLIFDEIDTGISGRTGSSVGEKMAALGEAHQVVCITHLAQIAALATRHFVVRKELHKGRMRTRVEPLEGETREKEIARLLGGETNSKIAQSHARELLTARRS